MTSPRIEQVFGRERLQMSASPHAEVVREAAAPGERRRFTKRFLVTPAGDFRAWTAREARILGHLRRQGVRPIPELVGLHAGAMQTFDAGVTVEQWTTLPVERDGHVLPHVFADCAHWWALTHHLLRALEALHALQVVHLDVAPANVCVPALGAAEGAGAMIGVKFARLGLIDFAFSLCPAEPLALSLPLDPQAEYQSPRLQKALAAGRAGNLRPTQVLDWRCDVYSAAAMLRGYLPASSSPAAEPRDGWTDERLARARTLLAALDAAHDDRGGATLPHQALLELCEAGMQDPDLVGSLLGGFVLAAGEEQADAAHAAPAPAGGVEPVAEHALLQPSYPVTLEAPDDAEWKTRERHHRVADPEPIGAASDETEAATVRRRASTPRAVAPAAATPGPRSALSPAIDTPGPDVFAPPPQRADREPPAVPTVGVDAGVAPAARRGWRPTATSRTRVAIATALGAVLVAAGIALFAFERQRGDALGPVARNDRQVTAAPASRSVDAHAPGSRNGAGNTHAAAPAATTSPAGGLPVDAATVQRAADADAVEKTPAEAREVASPGTPIASAVSAPDTPSVATRAAQPIPQPPQAAPTQLPQPSQAPPPTAQPTPSREAERPAPSIERQQPVPPSTAASPKSASTAEPAVAAISAGAVDDVAARTERDVARVLAMAANATGRAEQDRVVQVARSIRPVGGAPHVPTESPSVARRLNAEARGAWERGDVDRALALQQRAFRANPNDAEVTGNLAFYYLKVRPAQPALARRLALYALAARGQTFPAGRVEDWGTLAVASSLEGREQDAIKAMYVMSTVSGNPERACRAARLAVAQYGAPMKVPADAMLARIRERGEASGAPSCG